MAQSLQLPLDLPSFSAIRTWIVRMGCYALSCVLPTGSWVYLIDHSVQIGSQKLFVVLGCPLEDVPFAERPLQHRDLRLVHMALMENSNARTVAEELEQATQRTGIPRMIGADRGGDLDGGVALFQQNHPEHEVAHVHDLAHTAANVLKARRSQDPRWAEFATKMAEAGSKVRQTSDAHLRPPSLRPKARFMNVAPMVRFANRVLKLLDTGKANERTEKAFGWMRGYREALADWTSEQMVIETALTHVRTHGLHAKTVKQLKSQWLGLSVNASGQEVALKIGEVLATEAKQAQAEEILVGSTEVVESVFGKLKHLERSYAGDGFTDWSLALGALLGEWSEEKMGEALEEMPVKESESRFRKYFRSGVQRVRRFFGKDTEGVPNSG
jgi:hypothetical protein